MQAGETRTGPEASARAGRSAIYSVELEVFEGPLDLLLHLVRRHELEILDIPIAFITEKYLEYLDLMRSLDLEVAGDYLVMAATLAWLKSRELLPVEPLPSEAGGDDDEDGEDPREALIRRLVEYERFKNAAADLDSLPVSGRDVFARGADIEVPAVDPGLAPVTLFRLAEAYYRVLTRAKINKSHEVQLEPVTVAQRMTQLTLLLDQKQAFDFEALFLGRTWTSERELRGMLVVTLMSVLELVKLGVAGVQQIPETDAIRVYRLDASEEARALIEMYDEEASFGDAGRPPPPPPPLTEAELDAAEESALLAEALAGADDTDLGPDAGTSPAANAPLKPVRDATDDEHAREATDADEPETTNVDEHEPDELEAVSDAVEADDYVAETDAAETAALDTTDADEHTASPDEAGTDSAETAAFETTADEQQTASSDVADVDEYEAGTDAPEAAALETTDVEGQTASAAVTDVDAFEAETHALETVALATDTDDQTASPGESEPDARETVELATTADEHTAASPDVVPAETDAPEAAAPETTDADEQTAAPDATATTYEAVEPDAPEATEPEHEARPATANVTEQEVAEPATTADPAPSVLDGENAPASTFDRETTESGPDTADPAAPAEPDQENEA